jgi:hypothetical protein
MGFTHRPGTARAATPALTGDGICVVRGSTETEKCLDLQGDVYQAGNPIVFYGFDATEDRFRWGFAYQGYVTYNAATNTGKPFKNAQTDQYYDGDPIFYIEKKTPTGHDGCAGLGQSLLSPGVVVWKPCASSSFTPDETLWVAHHDFFVNVGATNASTTGPVLMASDTSESGATVTCDISSGAIVNIEGRGLCNETFYTRT